MIRVMDKKTIRALRASIRKWERNAKVKHPDKYLLDSDDCPLCGLFFHHDCEGCPVMQKTGRPNCGGTPYIKANIACSNWEWQAGPMEEAHAAAQEEVAFLKSLLPEQEP